MSVFGGTFKPVVIRQLEARQRLISDGNDSVKRTRNVQVYTTSKTAWSRMVSFVNYSADPNTPPNDQLARKYVLQAGTLIPSGTDPNNFALRAGVGNVNGVYGSNLGNRQLGLRPMPGIISVNVTNKGAYGSLRLTTVKFKAWDKAQLDDLEILYMRAGYPVLVEWGWSMYMDTASTEDKDHKSKTNKGSVKTADAKLSEFINKPMKPFVEPTINPFDTARDQNDIYDDIMRLNHTFSGNYDGMVGIVQNFTWELQIDGSYDCTTILVSMGDTLDSIKMNHPAKSENGASGGKIDQGYKTSFTQVLQDLIVTSTQTNKVGLVNFTDLNHNSVDSKILAPAKFNANEVLLKQRLSLYVEDTAHIDSHITLLDFFTDPNTGKGNTTVPAYIQLAYLVAIIKEGFGLFSESGTPLLNIEIPVHDTVGSFGNKGNGLCLASVDTISIDPSVCLIKNKQATWATGNDKGFDIGAVFNKSEDISLDFLISEETKATSKLGIIGNVYMNMQYVVNKFNDSMSSSSDGAVHIYSFIKDILTDVSKALGSINDFDVFVEDNRAVIIDKNYTELSSDSSKDTKFTMNIFGNNTVTRGFKILSKIFQSQVNMIAIAAGSSRLNLGGVNSSSQSYFNKGLVSRLGQYSTEGGADSTEDTIKKEKINLALSVLDLRDYLKKGVLNTTKPSFSPSNESTPAANTILNSIILNVNKDANYRSVIPISVEVTLDGIAGIAIGEVFCLNTDVLPKEYNRKDLGFIVTNLQQNIVRSDWTTTIGAYVILLNQGDDKKELSAINLTISEKESLTVVINQLKQDEINKQMQYVLSYIRLLYFIKYYYENNLYLNYSFTSTTAGATFHKVNYTGIRTYETGTSNNKVLGTYSGNSITVSDIQITVHDVNTPITINNITGLSEYKDAEGSLINKDNHPTYFTTPHNVPLLNPIISADTYNPTMKAVLTTLVNASSEYKYLSTEAPDLARDIKGQVSTVFDQIVKNHSTSTASSIISAQVTGTVVHTPTDANTAYIYPLLYNTDSSIGAPQFDKRDGNNIISINYLAKQR
jgi:hypothetical protein